MKTTVQSFSIGLFTLAFAATASAATPASISVQGVLRDGTGTLQSITINSIVANFYDAAATGTGNKLAGPYTASSVVAVNGLFTFAITDATLGASLAKSGTGSAFLELDITTTSGGSVDVYPRQAVTAEVFALQCANADNAAQLGGAAASSYLSTTTASSTYLAITAQAADSAKLGGVAASGYLTTSGTAANASSLGGVAAAGYLQTGSALTGAHITAGSIGSHTHAIGVHYGNEATVGVGHSSACPGGATAALISVCGGCDNGGDTVIGGVCRGDSFNGMVLIATYLAGATYCCGYNNTTGSCLTGRAQAICLTTTTAATSLP